MTTDAFRWRPEDNLHPIHPKVNTQVRAVDRAERIMQKVWGFTAVEDGPWVKRVDAAAVAAVLFDQARCPELAWQADAAAADFHRLAAEDAALRAKAEAEGDAALAEYNRHPLLHYDTHDTDYNPNATHEQGVTKFWRVGANHVDVVRDRWHDPHNRNRELNTTNYFASMLGNTRSQHDYWDCREYGCDGDCDLRCNVRLAKSCSGTTRTMPVDRSPLVMLFQCCRECEALAGKIAANTYKRALVNARADLPPGAVIDPGSPVPPLP